MALTSPSHAAFATSQDTHERRHFSFAQGPVSLIRYSLETPRILDACRITREILLQRFEQQHRLAAQFVAGE